MNADANDNASHRSGLGDGLALTQKRAHRPASCDQLTELTNRRCSEDVLTRIRSARHAALPLLLNIDELATVNDISVHEAADELVRKVAGCLRDEIGEYDFYRIGSDDFAIVDLPCGSHADLA